MRTTWIDSARELKDFCDQIDSDAIAVDTESDHFHAYQGRICLIQVATPQVAALVDPLALGDWELAPLFEVLGDGAVAKIMHAGGNDLIEFDRDYGARINHLFDTQVAVRLLGYERHSLNWLIEELLGAPPVKQFQRFDWTRRPIPEGAARYALEDVVHLFTLREILTAELAEAGWLEAFEQHCEHLARTTVHEPRVFDPEGWRRLKITAPDGRTRAALRELFIWRHELCTATNRAAVTIFPNAALIDIARRRPRSVAELSDMRRLPRPLVADYSAEIVAAIERSLQAPVPPEKLVRHNGERPSPDEVARFEALQKWRNRCTEELGVPAEFVANNATLMEIARVAPARVEELDGITRLLPWHVATFGDEIVALVRSA